MNTEITSSERAILTGKYYAGEIYEQLAAAYWAHDTRDYLVANAKDVLEKLASSLGFDLVPHVSGDIGSTMGRHEMAPADA